MMLACGQLAFRMAKVYQNPNSSNRIMLWYIPQAMYEYIQADMYNATISMSDLLQKSITRSKVSKLTDGMWRTHSSNFHASASISLLVGFNKDTKTPSEALEDGFMPEVSTSIKGEWSMSHAPTVVLGNWALAYELDDMYDHAMMHLTNLRIHLVYDPGVMCLQLCPNTAPRQCTSGAAFISGQLEIS
ncbi:hypothetical protein F4604DRAFT_1678014 [Suillus subluteus]|nr:hypothetical protein F4604DRAFT_1678014 [Suillus subluteus]